MASPLVSVVIPVYKSRAFLPKLVESLQSQTYSNWQAIFVNDGCPEDSGSLCDSYAASDPRIKVIHQKNSGPVSALNQGIRHAKGEWIMFLDADDWIDILTIQKATEIAIKENVDIVMWGNIKEYAHKSVPYPLFHPQPKKFFAHDFSFLQRRLIGLIDSELSNPIATDALSSGWAKLYRKSIIDQHDIQWTATQEVGSSDVLFNVQYFFEAKSAYYLPEHLHHYNKNNPNGLTKTYGWTLLPKFINLYHALQGEIEKKPKSDPSFKTALKNRLALSTINIGLSLDFSNDWSENRKYVEKMISHDAYRSALQTLNFGPIPFHFKIYLLSAKYNWSNLLLCLAYTMQKLKNR